MPSNTSQSAIGDIYTARYHQTAALRPHPVFSAVERAAPLNDARFLYVEPGRAGLAGWLDTPANKPQAKINVASIDPEWFNGWSHLWKEIGNAHEAAAFCRTYTIAPYLKPEKPTKYGSQAAKREAYYKAFGYDRGSAGIRGQVADAYYVDEVANYDTVWAAAERVLERERAQALQEDRGISAWVPASTEPAPVGFTFSYSDWDAPF